MRLRDPAIVRHVTITRPDATIEFEGRGDDWRLLRPVKDVAEARQVNVLVYSIVNADVDRRFKPNNLDEFGLPFATGVTYERCRKCSREWMLEI